MIKRWANMQKTGKLISLLVFLIAIGALMYLLLILKEPAEPKSKMLLGGKTFKVDVASTEIEKQQGLSGREGLAADEGMIFIYDQTGLRCLWMKDMNFSIDMIWLNEDKQISAIEPVTAPETYPRTFCHNAQYLVEVSAGTAGKLELQTGDQVDF